MRTKSKLLIIIVMLLSHISYGQLEPGETAPDWTLDQVPTGCDVSGGWGPTWNLYDQLNDGKNVVIDFSTTWCGPCWDYHQSGVLETLWNDHGLDGDDKIRVFFIESECNNNAACLCGSEEECSGGGTRGDWMAGASYPFFSPSGQECMDIKTDYAVTYFPTLYAINAEYKTAWEVGHLTVEQWESWLFDSFSMEINSDIEQTDCNTTIDLTVTGGYGDLSYKWSTGDLTEDLSGKLNGVYTVTVTDDNGYFLVKEISVSGDYTGCGCLGNVNVDLSSEGIHSVGDMLQAMGLNSLDELCNSSEQYNILLGGTLILDSGQSEPVCFNGVNIAMKKDASIIVKNNTELNLKNAKVFGCNDMWNEILIQSGSSINVTENTQISDARYAIYAEKGAVINASNSNFINNNIGIYLSAEGNGDNTDIHIGGCYFNSTDLFNNFNGNNNGNWINEDKPLAGIYIIGQDNVDLDNWNYDRNKFENLRNGIICYHGSVAVGKADFNNIEGGLLYRGGPSSSFSSGSFSYPFYNDGFAVKISNCTNKSRVESCSFNNVDYAVGGTYGELTVYKNKFNDVNTGVIGYRLAKVNVKYNFKFNARRRGIVLNNCLGGDLSGIIRFIDDDYNSIGIELQSSKDFKIGHFGSIGTRTSIVNSTVAGVLLQNSWGNTINAITISNTNTTRDGFGGIIFQNSDGNELAFGNISGNGDGSGIIVSDSYGCTYQCNSTSTNKYGMHIIGICDDSYLLGTSFSANDIDLVLGNPNSLNSFSNATFIGAQGDLNNKEGYGNKFSGEDSRVHNSGTQEIVESSKFLVKDDPVNPGVYLPAHIEAAGKWFYNRAKENQDPCGGDHGMILTSYPDCKDLIDKIKKIDTLGDMGDCTKIMWEYKYYKELIKMKKKGLLSDSCKMFLNTNMNKSIVQVVKISNAIDSIDSVKIKIKDWYYDNSSHEKYSDGGNSKDSIKIATDSVRWVIDNTELVDSCLKVLNKVNKVRLDQIDNDTLSKSDLELLMPIAESCPDELGEGVYWARGLLSLYSDIYYNAYDCMAADIAPRSAQNDKIEGNFSIFPNPAMNYVNILVDLKPEQSGEIQILDMNGNIKYHKVIYENEQKVDIQSYPVGVYFVKYKSNGGEEKIKKLVITK